MRILWKVATPAVLLSTIAGAAFGWRVHKTKTEAATLAEEVRIDRRGAEQGNAEAEYKLARLYFAGRGLPQSYPEAFAWYRAAADQGFAKAQFAVGHMDATARGVSQDLSSALAWDQKAADQGEPRAQDELGTLYYYGTGVAKDYARAAEWYRKAADQGYVYAEADLGAIYYNGKATPKNYVEAAYWYRKAADQGNARAEYDLGYMDYYGEGMPVNQAEGRRLIRKAADQGDNNALRAVSYSLTTFFKVDLLVQLLGGMFFAVSFVRLRFNHVTGAKRLLTFREKVLGAAAALILISTGYAWYGYTHLEFRRLSYGPNTSSLVHWLLDAASIVLLIYVLRWDKEIEAEASGNGFRDDGTACVGSTNI